MRPKSGRGITGEQNNMANGSVKLDFPAQKGKTEYGTKDSLDERSTYPNFFSYVYIGGLYKLGLKRRFPELQILFIVKIAIKRVELSVDMF